MGKAKFWPPGVSKPLNGFRWNLEYIIGSRVCPHMQIHVALRRRGWSGRTREKTRVLVSYRCTFSKGVLLYSSARAQPAHVDRFWRSMRHLENRKSAISPGRFDRSSRNLATWCVIGLWTGSENGKSDIEEYLLMRRPVRVKSAIHRVGKSRIICYVIYFTYFT